MTPTLTLPEVPMPKQPSMADLLNSLLAPGEPQKAQQQAAPTPTPPEAAEGPARSRPEVWRTLRTPGGIRPSPRQQARDARMYAEVWYQALREWRLFDGDTVRVSRGPAKSSRMRVVGVGNWGGSAGAFGSYLAAEAMLSTPIGGLPAARVALAITDQGSRELERVRGGQGPESLLRETGAFVHPVGPTREYALAVLALAAGLGDGNAKNALETLSAVVD